MSLLKEPKSHTRKILGMVLPKYCRGKVVDVGAGRGKYKNMILGHANEYISIDNQSSRDQFQNSTIKNPLNIVGDVKNMPIEDSSFDTVICTEVIEHIDNPFVLMKELSRILKKDGYLILSSGWMAPYHPEPKDYFRFSEDAYNYLCSVSGLEMVEIIKKGGYFTMMFYFLLRTIDLHGKITKKILLRLNKYKFFYPLENLFYWIDDKINTKDTVGHLIVAKKK